MDDTNDSGTLAAPAAVSMPGRELVKRIVGPARDQGGDNVQTALADYTQKRAEMIRCADQAREADNLARRAWDELVEECRRAEATTRGRQAPRLIGLHGNPTIEAQKAADRAARPDAFAERRAHEARLQAEPAPCPATFGAWGCELEAGHEGEHTADAYEVRWPATRQSER